ncbi:MAG: SET domain-containing protein [bacterium]
MADIIVKKSKIRGKGVFAARNFKKGEVVIKWEWKKVFSKDEVKKLPEEIVKYISKYNGKYILMGEPERYVNHSCEANTKDVNGADVAKRDIKKGEEITACYSNEGILNSFICKCGSKNCKGVIRDKKDKKR